MVRPCGGGDNLAPNQIFPTDPTGTERRLVKQISLHASWLHFVMLTVPAHLMISEPS